MEPLPICKMQPMLPEHKVAPKAVQVSAEQQTEPALMQETEHRAVTQAAQKATAAKTAKSPT